MKTRFAEKSYEELMALPKDKPRKPKKPNLFFRTLVRILTSKDLIPAKFTYTDVDLSRAGKGPYLILMNHSCFLDLEIVSKIFYPKPYGIVTTTDGFVGKNWLMRQLGCIPTQKFISDFSLIRNMDYMLKKKKTSVLMYPEACYSFDGRATPLPRKMGALLKHLKVPVVHVHTDGAFLRTPLYNELRNRRVKVSATVRCLLTVEEIEELSVEELDGILDRAFGFDHFKWQKENGVRICEKDRAVGLERLLYKCPHCLAEGKTRGEGDRLICDACKKVYVLSELGEMCAEDGATEYAHIPDWCAWERACVKEELESGTYSLDTDVAIGAQVNSRAIYMIGEGRLRHDREGFLLTGCDGKLSYRQKPLFSYTLNVDYYWYQISDMISVGTRDCLYYCFPKKEGVVTKTRYATEELFKLSMRKIRQ